MTHLRGNYASSDVSVESVENLLIDYGASEQRDQSGEAQGFFRTFDYGFVVYAPSMGPAACYERYLVFIREELNEGAGEIFLSLVEVKPGKKSGEK